MKALVVVDFQNDFVTGALGCEAAKSLEMPIAERIEEYLSKGDMVVFTKDWHDPVEYLNTQEGRRLPVPHCICEPGRSLYGKVNDYCNDSNTLKKFGFGSKDLPNYFKGKDVEEFELCGLYITPCLMTNALVLKAFFPEARIVVDSKLTMAIDRDIGEKALDVMENMQIDVLNRDKTAKEQIEFYQ